MSAEENSKSSSSGSDAMSQSDSTEDTSANSSSELDEASKVVLGQMAKHPNERDVKVTSTQVRLGHLQWLVRQKNGNCVKISYFLTDLYFRLQSNCSTNS
jgi:hypothetical protein